MSQSLRRRLFALLPVAALLAAASASPAAQSAPVYAVSGSIPGAGAGWEYASFDPVHRRVYIGRGDGLSALGVDTGVFTAHLADGAHTHEPLVLHGGDQILLTNGGGQNALLLNAADGKLIASIPTTPFPDAAVYDPASGQAAVFGATGFATLVDPAAKASAGQIEIGGKLEFGAADGHGRVFVNVENQNQIAVLDLKAKAVTARYKLDGCDSPGGMAYAAGADVLIVSCDNQAAQVIAARTGAVLATLAIGKGPDAVLYDPRRNLAFVPCGRDGVLVVIAVHKGADAAVIQTVKTELGARTGAVDPKTGKVYLPAASYGPPATPGARPAMIPDSFHLVVVSPAG